MKKTIALLSFILSFAFIFGCAPDSRSGNNTSSETDSQPEPPKTVTVFEGGRSDYILMRGEDVRKTVSLVFSQFRHELEKRSECKLELATDLLGFDQVVDPNAHEFLVGETNREESIKIKKAVEEKGGNRFGIYVSESKVAVYAENEYLVFLGLDYIMSEFIKQGDDGKPVMKIEAGYEYISDETASMFDPEEAVSKGVALRMVADRKLARVNSIDNFGIMQGGGTDGKYAYYAMISKQTTPEQARIHKFDLETWEQVAVSEPLPTAHTNDITYDKVNDRLVISYCSSTDGHLGITFVDPNTLEFISYKKTNITNRAVEYLPDTNEYILAGGYTIYHADSNFKKKSSFNCSDPQYITQGFCSDGKYIYDVRYISGAKTHYIIIHTLDGTYIDSVPLTNIEGEPENIFRRGDEFIIGCNISSSVFSVKLVPDNWW